MVACPGYFSEIFEKGEDQQAKFLFFFKSYLHFSKQQRQPVPSLMFMSQCLRQVHELAHQFRAFQQRHDIEAHDFDNETLLLQNFILLCYPETPRSARHYTFPLDWASSCSSLHQAVLEIFYLIDSENIPTSIHFIEWSLEAQNTLWS